MGNVNAIALGPGTLYTAAVGAAEPATLVAAWDAAWTDLGYTFEGHTFSSESTVEEVEVAEELVPLLYVTTKVVAKAEFTLAEVTATNLSRRAYAWQSTDGEERMVWRQCFNSGTVEINRRKGADKAGIPFELNLEKPSGLQPWKYYAVSPDRA